MPDTRHVGRYELCGVVGKGGFGVVEECRDLLTNEHVAIKTIPARFVNQESKRLVREIDTMSFLHDAHPHVISFFSIFVTPSYGVDGRSTAEDDTFSIGPMDAGQVPQRLDVMGPEYANLGCGAALIKHQNELEAEVAKIHASDEFNLHIVMPLMKGDLLYFIKHASPSSHKLAMTDEFIEQVTVVFAFQICFGLDYLHKCNIVHRDMKPENILVRLHNTNPYESTALIADLGLARDAQASDTFYVCTRYYRPPEIITNVSRGETSIDVWSLGCIFFEMVTGRALFTVNSALNEHGIWEGQRASTQLEVILNIVGTPTQDEIQRFMPLGNARLYLLRSVPRPSRLVEMMKNNWRLHTTQDRQEKWIDLISRCLAFFPEQRPKCEDLCRHQLFQECNVFYGENVKQHDAREYQPMQVGTLVAENKQIVLHLVQSALQKCTPYIEEEGSTDEIDWGEEDGFALCGGEVGHLNNDVVSLDDSNATGTLVQSALQKCTPYIEEEGSTDEIDWGEEDGFALCGGEVGHLNNDVVSLDDSNATGTVLMHPLSSHDGTPSAVTDDNAAHQRSFPFVSDPELRRQYAACSGAGEAREEAVSRLLNDLQYHTHDPERSEQLR
ncbi:protein kinase, partial [Trypanosoma grayi]|uniref:protein kinase n=1 Tax=Trypanosoma grayi TaxID=71804 RepID=UPI0004F4522F